MRRPLGNWTSTIPNTVALIARPAVDFVIPNASMSSGKILEGAIT